MLIDIHDMDSVALNYSVANIFYPENSTEYGRSLYINWIAAPSHRIQIPDQGNRRCVTFRPTEDWRQAGELITKHKISIIEGTGEEGEAFKWKGRINTKIGLLYMEGDHPLIAAMRALVKSYNLYNSKLEVPDLWVHIPTPSLSTPRPLYKG